MPCPLAGFSTKQTDHHGPLGSDLLTRIQDRRHSLPASQCHTFLLSGVMARAPELVFGSSSESSGAKRQDPHWWMWVYLDLETL